jgi:T-complex protein 1 subunit eta
MDKLIHTENKTTISNDGATILEMLDIIHPAAKSLTEIAKAQDNEMGDGTTSVVVLCGELLKESKKFIEEKVHSQVVIKGLREGLRVALERLKELEVKVPFEDKVKLRSMLMKCAGTAMSSKLISNYTPFFAEMIVTAVEKLENDSEKSLIGMKKVTGGSVTDSFLVEGVAFKKTFSYAGFEQQPKKQTNAKVILLNIELELKAEKENAEIRIKPDEYQKIIDAEWQIIYSKLDKIVKSGANVVLSKLPIGDLATQYFADRNIFCAGRVPDEDMKRVAKATGATIQTTVSNITEIVLGKCGDFEEKQIGNERYNIFSKCEKTKSATIIIRGGAEQYLDETERSLNDAIMVVRRAIKASSIVAGGGAIEMELSKYIKEYSKTISGKIQLIVNAYAKSFEVIPKTLADNGGLDSVDIMASLRKMHTTPEGRWFGVDLDKGTISDMMEKFVWEPTQLKRNILTSSVEAACLILSVDETIKNPMSEQDTQATRKHQRAALAKKRAMAKL